jgi:hypothetical protein
MTKDVLAAGLEEVVGEPLPFGRFQLLEAV